MTTALHRVCLKLYATVGDDIPGATFVPIFHEWIRDRRLDGVLLDVADYTHVPESPGVMLMTHAVAFSLDRADGRFGIQAQRRRAVDGDSASAIAATLAALLAVADLLQRDPRVEGRLQFDRRAVRVESNDRLRAPNSDAGFDLLSRAALGAWSATFPGHTVSAARVVTDPRDRLSIEVRAVRDER
jgi:hypothetical protein